VSGDTKVEIALSPPPAVKGTLRMQGGRQPKVAVVELENESESRHIRRAIDGNGRFEFEHLPPGEYTPLLMSADSRLRLSGVSANGRAVTGNAIVVDRAMEVELTAVAGGAEVSGFVYRESEPKPGVLVVLAPERESASPYDYLAYLTDSDGSFSFESVAPGAYRIVPIEDWADVEYTAPDVLRRYEGAAREVRVEADARQEIRLNLK
jgi:hypothetical protein